MPFFFSSRRRHTRYIGDWSSDVCSSDLLPSAADCHLVALRNRPRPLLDSGRRRDLPTASAVNVNEALALRALLVVLGYLSGSIPVGVLVARASGGPDPRSVGSGRTGGTNALRALGRK